MLFVLISVVGNAKKGKKDSKRFLLERPFKMILNLVESKRSYMYIFQYKFTLYNRIEPFFPFLGGILHILFKNISGEQFTEK